MSDTSSARGTSRRRAWRPNYLLDGVNHMDNVGDFLRRWKGATHTSDSDLSLITTPFGNINESGVAGEYRSPDLVRTESRFYAGVEPGVRELVALLVERFGWTTYTSCQGHTYPGTAILPVERHVGVLPSGDAEYAHVRALVESLVNAFAHQQRSASIRPFLLELMLTSNDGRYPVIDVVFRKSRSLSWDGYFLEIESAYQTTLAILRAFVERRASLLSTAE